MKVHFQLFSLAIHDTSSVVGVGMKYGEQALETGASTKLARALWIIPLVFVVHSLHQRYCHDLASDRPKHKHPWFILGFIAMAGVVTFMPALSEAGNIVADLAKQGLVLTLFLIGASLDRDAIASVGIKPLLFGLALWVVVASGSFFAVNMGLIDGMRMH